MLFESPKNENYSDICKATSLFGTITKLKMPRGSLNNLFRIGNANAAVLPDPVSEWTILVRNIVLYLIHLSLLGSGE
jgi:hypothetical protein